MKINFAKTPVSISRDKPAFMRNSFFDKKLGRDKSEEPVKVNYRRNPVKMNGAQSSINTDMSKGMRDDRQPDKMPFDTWQVVENMYSDKGNLVLRPGYEQFTESTNLLDLYIHEKKSGNELYVAQINGTNKDILAVDRDDGTTANKFTITGDDDISFASQSGFLYLANGVDDINIWDGSAKTTIALPDGKAKLIASDGSRLWAVEIIDDNEEVLRFSQKTPTGVVASFDTGVSTGVDRSGVATSKITKYTALLAIGESVFAFGEGRIECHRIPTAIGIDVDAFYANVTTLAWERSNFGVKTSQAAINIGGEIWFKDIDNFLYKINQSGNLKTVAGLEDTMSKLDWSNAKLSYFKEKRLVLINGKDQTEGDTTIAYNEKEESFSKFTNIFPEKIAFDDDGYYWTSPDKFIFKLTPNAYTDDGLDIDWKVLSQASYAGDMMRYKKIFELFLYVRIFETIDIKTNIYVDRRTYGRSGETKSVEYNSVQQEELFEKAPEIMGIGMFAGALVTFDEDVGTEIAYNSQRINRLFQRVEVEYSGSSKEPFEIKGAGFSFFPTNKKLKNLIYT